MYENHEKGREIPHEDLLDPQKARGVLGEHAITMFLPCGIFLTAGWEGIMAILMVALRVGMCEQPYEAPQPNAPLKKWIQVC